ncbi:MAG: CRISPR-associated endonuclease Cas1 [Acidobacteria bacterium]|nr:CRISPR-associated endonuclease Cas1 [Acidobacteriota bacterium]
MAVLYITEQGSVVNLAAGRVAVRKGEELIQDMPVFKLEQIVAYGNIHLTPAVIKHCLRQGIEVAFLSGPGKYEGRLQPEFTKNAVTRLKQYQRAVNPDFCMKLATTIVIGKVRNMIAMIKQQRRLREALRESGRNGAREDGRAPLAELEALCARVPGAKSLENLNGHEGAATVMYFKAFRAALKGDWKFETRQYHPPQDPVNVLLSLGYTLLYNDLYAAVNLVGLDPYMGFYHQPRHGHAALASDLMEDLRAVLVDRMVLTALNRRVFSEADFQRDPADKLLLKQEALKRFFALYAQTVQEKTWYAYAAIQTSYRQVMELQVRHFARVLAGEEPLYHPFNAEAALNGK